MNGAAGMVLVLPNGWMPFVDYEGLTSHRLVNRQRVTFGVRKEL